LVFNRSHFSVSESTQKIRPNGISNEEITQEQHIGYTCKLNWIEHYQTRWFSAESVAACVNKLPLHEVSPDSA
jgi:hypothetical protein